MRCWLTIGFRQSADCSMCKVGGEHREVRVNVPGMPTPCIWVYVCDTCWAEQDKLETAPFDFPPKKSMAAEGLFYG